MAKAMLLLSILGLCCLVCAAQEPVDLSGTWVLDNMRSDARAAQTNISGPLVIVQAENEIQLHVTASGRRAFENFRFDRKNVLRLPNGHEITTQAEVKGNSLTITTTNRYPGHVVRSTRKYSLSRDGKTLNVQDHGMKLVYRRYDNTDVLLDMGELRRSQSDVRLKFYEAAAIDAAKRQRPVGGSNLAVVGAPALKPPGFGLPIDAPDAIVLVNLYSGTSLQEQAIVMFEGNQPEGTLFSPRESPFSEGTLEESEFQRVEGELDEFFSTLLASAGGNERLYPYLPDDIRSLFKQPERKFRMYMPPGAVDPIWRDELAHKSAQSGAKPHPLDGLDAWDESLSDEELRRFASLQIEVAIQQSLLAVKGQLKEGEAQSSLLRPQLLVSNPREFLKTLEDSALKNRRLLADSGILMPENLRLTSNYLKRILGHGFVIKEVSKPNPCPCFLASGGNDTLYVISLGAPLGGPAVHFTRQGGSLRIACIAIP